MAEYLKSFRVISDNDISQQTRFEIKTDKNTYTTIWEYKVVPSVQECRDIRQYNTTLKTYCRLMNIDMRCYNIGGIR